MKIIIGLLFLQMIKTVDLEEIVDTTLILRSTITLDCKYSGNETVIQIRWAKVNGSLEEEICTIDRSYGKYISQKYMNRLSYIVENSALDLSITLREASKVDIGIYVCYLAVFPSGTKKKVIAVQEDDFGHIVPSSHQTFKENSKITLNFQNTLLSGVNKIILEKFANGKMSLVTYCKSSKYGRKLLSYGFDFIKRTFVNCSDFQNVTLMIHQAAIMDEGIYQCHFWSDDKNQTISINVHMQTIGLSSMSTFALICGVSSLVVLGIFILAAFCLVRTRKNKKIQAKQGNVSFNSTYPQLQIDAVDNEHTYANFELNSSFSKSWT